jgi:hypothetical protein
MVDSYFIPIYPVVDALNGDAVFRDFLPVLRKASLHLT